MHEARVVTRVRATWLIQLVPLLIFYRLIILQYICLIGFRVIYRADEMREEKKVVEDKNDDALI